MTITWYGEGCYKLQKTDLSIIIDPESSESGNRLKGDLILKTYSSFPPKAGENEIVGPGEYEINEVLVKGEMVESESSEELIKTVYKVVFDDITFGILGNISTELSEKELDLLSDIDILFVPSNDFGLKMIKNITPKIVITGWGDPKKIAAELGKKIEPVEKFTIKKKDIAGLEGLTFVSFAN